jgi:hypothetical protein
VFSAGYPCASSRCLRLSLWEKNMRDLGDRIRAVTGVPPADIGPIDIPPRPPGGHVFASGGPIARMFLPLIRVEEHDGPPPPREPGWQEHRRTWLETGDLSALTAMDACDPVSMSGDDWLDCDEYDALRAPAPELLPPPSARHRVATAIVLAVLLGWLLATLIYYGVI